MENYAEQIEKIDVYKGKDERITTKPILLNNPHKGKEYTKQVMKDLELSILETSPNMSMNPISSHIPLIYSLFKPIVEV